MPQAIGHGAPIGVLIAAAGAALVDALGRPRPAKEQMAVLRDVVERIVLLLREGGSTDDPLFQGGPGDAQLPREERLVFQFFLQSYWQLRDDISLADWCRYAAEMLAVGAFGADPPPPPPPEGDAAAAAAVAAARAGEAAYRCVERFVCFTALYGSHGTIAAVTLARNHEAAGHEEVEFVPALASAIGEAGDILEPRFAAPPTTCASWPWRRRSSARPRGARASMR